MGGLGASFGRFEDEDWAGGFLLDEEDGFLLDGAGGFLLVGAGLLVGS